MTKDRVIAIGIAAVIILGILFKMFFHHPEAYEVGLSRNQLTGEVSLVESAGFNFSPPGVWVSIIDTRPTTVCITSTAQTYNCKLARFNPAYFREFVAVEGWYYYWWANRLSFNYGYNDEYRGMRDILRGHAFGVKRYPFIEAQETISDGTIGR